MNPVRFSGQSYLSPGSELTETLEVEPGCCLIEDFSDGKIRVEVKHQMSSRDAYVPRSTGAPGGRNLLEMPLLVDALGSMTRN